MLWRMTAEVMAEKDGERTCQVSNSAPHIDVVVASYQRPEHLSHCLNSLRAQELPPQRILVVLRSDDLAARRIVAAREIRQPVLRTVTVAEPGVVAALRAGVARSTAEIIGFTDDDAEVGPTWTSDMVKWLGREGIGGVGGRDVIPGQAEPMTTRVGAFGRWGQLYGNHHLGMGSPREVQVLKGVNMAFRADALALPASGVMRGSGAEVYFELLMCGWAMQRGWKLIYDPVIAVSHNIAGRHGPDQRGKPKWSAIRDAAHNYVVASAVLGIPRGIALIVRAMAIGNRGEPSIGRAAIALVRGERGVLGRVLPALWGKALGFAHLFCGPRTILTAKQLRASSHDEGWRLAGGNVSLPDLP
jgi:hypothetical protein